MLFNSYIFIFLFAPLSIAGYYLLNHFKLEKLAQVFLVIASWIFYAYFEISYLFILLGSIAFNYLCIALLKRNTRKIYLIIGIVGNIGVIFYYKYLSFSVENLNSWFNLSIPVKNILMPLGISFFTFQQISYLVDTYRKETFKYSFLDYVLFVSFFPQLIAGPIVTHDEIIPMFHEKERKKFSSEEFACGIYMFAVGLFKKVLLADTLGVGADYGFSSVGVLSGIDSVLVMFMYTFQLYFDFSGYCDMACGLAKMFHLELPINFNSPYKSVSIADFWKRWHMSLTRFLTKYVYIPLGGSRKGKIRTYINIFIVFFVSGIWHGAAWTYILWGGIHGIAQCLYRLFSKIWDRLPKLIACPVNFVFFSLTCIVFRAVTVKDAMTMLSTIFTCKSGGISAELAACFDTVELSYIRDHFDFWNGACEKVPGLHMWLILLLSTLIIFIGKNLHERKFKPCIKTAIGSAVMLVWSIISLSGLSTFLYFNF